MFSWIKRAQKRDVRPITIVIHGASMGNSDDVAKELLYHMKRNGGGKFGKVL